MTDAKIVVKSLYKEGEVRRATMPATTSFAQLILKLRELHDLRSGFVVKYKDSDEDMIAMDSEMEWQEAQDAAGGDPVRLFIFDGAVASAHSSPIQPQQQMSTPLFPQSMNPSSAFPSVGSRPPSVPGTMRRGSTAHSVSSSHSGMVMMMPHPGAPGYVASQPQSAFSSCAPVQHGSTTPRSHYSHQSLHSHHSIQSQHSVHSHYSQQLQQQQLQQQQVQPPVHQTPPPPRRSGGPPPPPLPGFLNIAPSPVMSQPTQQRSATPISVTQQPQYADAAPPTRATSRQMLNIAAEALNKEQAAAPSGTHPLKLLAKPDIKPLLQNAIAVAFQSGNIEAAFLNTPLQGLVSQIRDTVSRAASSGQDVTESLLRLLGTPDNKVAAAQVVLEVLNRTAMQQQINRGAMKQLVRVATKAASKIVDAAV